jgi:hypothetical protein
MQHHTALLEKKKAAKEHAQAAHPDNAETENVHVVVEGEVVQQ